MSSERTRSFFLIFFFLREMFGFISKRVKYSSYMRPFHKMQHLSYDAPWRYFLSSLLKRWKNFFYFSIFFQTKQNKRIFISDSMRSSALKCNRILFSGLLKILNCAVEIHLCIFNEIEGLTSDQSMTKLYIIYMSLYKFLNKVYIHEIHKKTANLVVQKYLNQQKFHIKKVGN